MRPASPDPAGAPCSRCCSALLVLPPASAGAWGFAAHRLVNEEAARTLPDPLRELFEGNVAVPAPALRRPRPLEGPSGGREAEPLPGPRRLRRSGSGLGPRLGGRAPEASRRPRPRRTGASPGAWARPTATWSPRSATRDPGRVLERAAVLGHYVADAHVPLHATVNYDGQLSGQDGVHARWEIELFDRYERQLAAAGDGRRGGAGGRPGDAHLRGAAALPRAGVEHPRRRSGVGRPAGLRRNGDRRPLRRRLLLAAVRPRGRGDGRPARGGGAGRWARSGSRRGRRRDARASTGPSASPFVRGESRLVVAVLDGVPGRTLVDARRRPGRPPPPRRPPAGGLGGPRPAPVSRAPRRHPGDSLDRGVAEGPRGGGRRRAAPVRVRSSRRPRGAAPPPSAPSPSG